MPLKTAVLLVACRVRSSVRLSWPVAVWPGASTRSSCNAVSVSAGSVSPGLLVMSLTTTAPSWPERVCWEVMGEATQAASSEAAAVRNR